MQFSLAVEQVFFGHWEKKRIGNETLTNSSTLLKKKKTDLNYFTVFGLP